jgi:uncharacterized protein YigE (DUF2233 family)
MKKLLFLILLFVCPVLLEAAWSVTERERIDAAPGVEFTRMQVAQDRAKAELHVVSFASKTHTLAVVDNPDGTLDLAKAAQARGAAAAVNGGYFHPDRRPLGLAISGGQTLHGFERAKLLSGIVTATGRRISLLRAGEWKKTSSAQEALQAGPFLIDGGKPVPSLNAARTAARTVVFNDGAGRAGVLVCRWVTLAEMAEILTTPELLPGIKIARALNLDGGSSSGLWVRRNDGGAPFYLREGKDVRNYLAVVPQR